jgi:DNA repair protein RadA/Sms
MSTKSHFVCSNCGYESGKWLGRCPDCSAWNSFTEIAEAPSAKKSSNIIDLTTSVKPQQLSKVKSNSLNRIETGFSESDRVLGGGVVEGSAILLSGDPGVGKSTLLLQIARNISRNKKLVLYVSGEESEGQIKIRAERIGVKDTDNMLVFSNGDIDQVIAACAQAAPDVLIIDSIQTMNSSQFPGFAGSLPQIRHATSRIVSFAKKNNVPVFIVGHVTKEGEVAGPMLLSHMVDCVLYLEGEALTGTKILRTFKNRFGDTTEVGIFVMEESGLAEISEASNFFIDSKKDPTPGSCLTVVMEGSRPLICEIQALVVPSNLNFPRRVANGISEKRLELLLAVIQKHLKVPTDRMDIFVNVVGGLKITENASDLAVVMAVLSSFKNKPLKSTVAVAEIGLLSELKKVINEASRIKEAKKLGFKNIISSGNFKYLNDILKTL